MIRSGVLLFYYTRVCFFSPKLKLSANTTTTKKKIFLTLCSSSFSTARESHLRSGFIVSLISPSPKLPAREKRTIYLHSPIRVSSIRLSLRHQNCQPHRAMHLRSGMIHLWFNHLWFNHRHGFIVLFPSGLDGTSHEDAHSSLVSTMVILKIHPTGL